MKILEQILLTFLLNAAWQIGLIVIFAFACDWLLRGGAMRDRHMLWVATLFASLLLPAFSSARFARETFRSETPVAEDVIRPVVSSRILTPGIEIVRQPNVASAAIVSN